MTNQTEANPFADAVAAFVSADKKMSGAATVYSRLAFLRLINGEDTVDTLVTGLCLAANVKSKKGKANPQALKANGHSGLAEACRLFKSYDRNGALIEGVRLAVYGFVGFLSAEQETALLDATLADERYIAAGDDMAKQARAEAKVRRAFLSALYPDAPDSFASLRSAMDKAIAAHAKEASGDGEGEGEGGEGEGEGDSLAAAPSPLTLAELARQFAARVRQSSAEQRAEADAELTDVLAALRDAFRADADADAEAKAA